MNKLALLITSLALVLGACAPVPSGGGPTVEVPPEQVASCSPQGERVLRVTQRAPESLPINDVYATFIAVHIDPVTCAETPTKITASPTAAPTAATPYAWVEDSRCYEIEGSTYLTCELGNLLSGEAAAPVSLTLSPGVRLSCAASGFVGGQIQGYRPLLCSAR